MSNDQLATLTSTAANASDVWVPVTGTDVGDKRGLDVSLIGGNVTVSGSLTPEGYVAGKLTLVTINDSTWTAIPASPLANRQAVSVQNRSGQDIWMNWLASDLDATIKGWRIPDQYERSWPVQTGAVIYIKGTAGSVQILVEELRKL